MNIRIGYPYPFGLSFIEKEVNFSLYAPLTESLTLIFYDDKNHEVKKVHFDSKLNKTGYVWHIKLPLDEVNHLSYLYQDKKGSLILDPYARYLNTSTKWGEGAKPTQTKAIVKNTNDFDWEKVTSPEIPLKDLIIYEMHTRAFTIKADIKHPGTFLGIIEKIPYLKSLGINCIELLPIHEFNETENPHVGLYNFWGYSPLSYFAIMQRYATKPYSACDELKMLVKALHKNEIKIIIDVVYNHTAEGKIDQFNYNFKDLDMSYYIRDEKGQFIDYSGCGNTLDANRNPAKNLILDSLRYLCVDCHVDGFRFDLASTFYRDAKGTTHNSFIVKEILEDPILSQKILIAEAWDAKGLYQVGSFPGPFADWNGAYRDKVRSFFRNDPHSKGGFADAISGSHSLFESKGPSYSINFITAHDGFTLNDLFSYDHKHNEKNQEDNRDGSDHNFSFNCGHEGPSTDPAIMEKRKRLINASFATLFMSLGTPMIFMGDEYGHTRFGNNNPYCQDNELNYFLWDKVDKKKINLISRLIEIRRQIEPIFKSKFYILDEVKWHGALHKEADWIKNDFYLGVYFTSGFYLAFNLSSEDRMVTFPEGKWCLLLNSVSFEPQDRICFINAPYQIPAHSVSIFTKRDDVI